jgi:hypothetical protein
VESVVLRIPVHILWLALCWTVVCNNLHCCCCCAALDAFCESLDAAEILPYMPQLIAELLQVLQTGRAGVQEMALSAVGSIAAAAAEQAFQPYTGAAARYRL